MFERFTEPARLVVVQAQVAARDLHHRQIGTVHILLGLLRVESRAATALRSIGADRRHVEQQLIAIAGLGEALDDDEPGGKALDDGESGGEALDDGESGGEALDDDESGGEALDDDESGREALDDDESGGEALDDDELGGEALDDADGIREGAGAGSTIAFTAVANRALERSLREALSLGRRLVEPQHILLALERESEGVAARVLLHLGIDRRVLRAAMPELFRGPVAGVVVEPAVRPTISKVLPELELPPVVHGIGGGVIETGFDLGWRERPVTLAALGAAALTRRAFDPARTGMLEPLEMQILAFLTLEGRGDPIGPEAVNVESLAAALACDLPRLQVAAMALAASQLVVVAPDGGNGTGVAITRAGADCVESWLRMVAPLFEGWPPDHPGVDDATG